ELGLLALLQPDEGDGDRLGEVVGVAVGDQHGLGRRGGQQQGGEGGDHDGGPLLGSDRAYRTYGTYRSYLQASGSIIPHRAVLGVGGSGPLVLLVRHRVHFGELRLVDLDAQAWALRQRGVAVLVDRPVLARHGVRHDVAVGVAF